LFFGALSLASALPVFQSAAVSWLTSVDVSLFRAINQGLSNPFFDWLMPVFAWNAFFVPLLLAGGVALLWKGGPRGRIFVLLLALIVGAGDGLVINTVKDLIVRQRPHEVLENVNLLVGRGRSQSMPSSHTATWFAGTLLAFAFYRRSFWFMLPLALMMAFSRVYVGAHYPSDVVAGALLGMGYAAAGLIFAEWLWSRVGARLAPTWFQQTPVLVKASGVSAQADPAARLDDRSYLRLGYVIIAAVLLARLLYIASDAIELSEDEAYQWLWSKHLALSYYSKPLMIALAQWLGTSIWGDTEFGVRFLSPVIAAILASVLLRFFGRQGNARGGFWLVLILNSTPLLGVGSTLLTVDPLLALFWTAAMVTGWRAVQGDGTLAHWAWTGVWMGLGFLSKYTAALQIVCFAIYFLAQREARFHLRRPGPYVALLIVALCTIPVIVWNAQHNWVTAEHVASNAIRNAQWKPLQSFGEFFGAEFGLLNPVFFVGALWAMFACWRQRTVLSTYFFCMGAPVFLGYMLFSFYKRVFPNWIAASVVPLFCLMVVYWQARAAAGWRLPKRGLAVGLGLGAFAVIVLHDTDLTRKVIGRSLPATIDPLRRVRSWSDTANVIGRERANLAGEGKPVFIIADHYGMAGQLSFYLPEAKQAVQRGGTFVYAKTQTQPRNQFYFWPGYRAQRQGQNAIFVDELSAPKLARDWWKNWLKGSGPIYSDAPISEPQIPAIVRTEFESITDLGVREIKYRGRVFRRVQLYACRNLR
jgi:membrane-associated phospholipid phosphatase